MESTSRRVVGWLGTFPGRHTSCQLRPVLPQSHHASWLRFSRCRTRSFHAGLPSSALQSRSFARTDNRSDGRDVQRRSNQSQRTVVQTKQPWRPSTPSTNFSNRPARGPRQSWIKSSDGRTAAVDPPLVKPTQPPFTVGSDPYLTATKLKKYLSRPNLSAVDIEAVESVIKSAPKSSVNVVAWNLLLQAYGKGRMYARMWKTYNDMKKTGITPSSRTYTIMLSHYSRSRETSERTVGRATILFDQSQRYLSILSGSEDGVEQVTGANHPSETQTANPSITNAYLSCLAHFGKVEEMKRVFEIMGNGVKPDAWTYSVMFGGLLGDRETAGAEAGMIWDRMIREDKDQIDSAVAIAAMRCFILGDKAIQQKGIDLLRSLYGLSLPGQSSLTGVRDLPTLKLDERAAETGLKLCLAAGRSNVAAHIAEQILENKELASTLRIEALNAILSAFAVEGDIKRCLEVLAADKRWTLESYVQVLRGVVGKGDADAAEEVIAAAEKRGLRPSAQVLGMLVRTSINSGRISSMRKAWKVYQDATSGQTEKNDDDIFWENKLRHDVVELIGRLVSLPSGARTGVDREDLREMTRVREKLMKEVAPRRRL